MADRNAAATYFGFDFQARAAIVIMLDNIKEAQSIKLEGEEDIEIDLKNGRKILAQAKAVVRVDDFSHVREKLKSAIESLSEGAARVDAQQLILLTNSPNPFNDINSRPLFWGPNKVDFGDLPESSQQLISDYLAQIDNPMNPKCFTVQRVPFHSSNEEERAKAIKESIRSFLGSISIMTPGIENQLYDIWSSQLLFNGTVDKKLHLSKKGFIWPIIVIETDISNIDDEMRDDFDDAEYADITRLYHDIINSHCEKFEFVSRVLTDYNLFVSSSRKAKAMEFAKAMWSSYSDAFDVSGIDRDTLEDLTTIVLYSVVRRWRSIERIRQGANL